MGPASACTLWWATVALAAAPPMEKPAPRPSIDWVDYPQVSMHFPSGIRIVLQEDHSAPIVQTYAIVGAGSSADPVGKEGTAHYAEHLWFRSQSQGRSVMDGLEDLGGVFNATTSLDATDFTIVARAEFLPDLFRLESQRLTDPCGTISRGDFGIERDVILNERRSREQQLGFLLSMMQEVLYPADHPYGRPASLVSLARISMADACTFAQTHYTPANTTLFVTGDFTVERAISNVFEFFAPHLLHPDLKPEHLHRQPREGVQQPDPQKPEDWVWDALDPAHYPAKRTPLTLLNSSELPPRVANRPTPLPELTEREIAVRKGPVEFPVAMIGYSLPGTWHNEQFYYNLMEHVAKEYVGYYLANSLALNHVGKSDCSLIPGAVNATLICAVAILRPDLITPEQAQNLMLDGLGALKLPETGQAYNQIVKEERLRSMADIALYQDVVSSTSSARTHSAAAWVHYTGQSRYIPNILDTVMTLDAGRLS